MSRKHKNNATQTTKDFSVVNSTETTNQRKEKETMKKETTQATLNLKEGKTMKKKENTTKKATLQEQINTINERLVKIEDFNKKQIELNMLIVEQLKTVDAKVSTKVEVAPIKEQSKTKKETSKKESTKKSVKSEDFDAKIEKANAELFKELVKKCLKKVANSNERQIYAIFTYCKNTLKDNEENIARYSKYLEKESNRKRNKDHKKTSTTYTLDKIACINVVKFYLNNKVGKVM